MKERWTARWFRKRALLYHLLVAILAPGCLYAGWWQITRAESGNTLSYLYAVEWPIFAVLSVVGWWQLIHEDPAAVESRKVERARRAANRGPFVPPPPDAASGFYHPLGPGSFAALEEGGSPNGIVRSVEVDAGPGQPGDEPVAVHALSSYNAYLARLSAGGGRKSWRNPHGLAAGARRIEPAAVEPGGDERILGRASRAEVGPGPAESAPDRSRDGRA